MKRDAKPRVTMNMFAEVAMRPKGTHARLKKKRTVHRTFHRDGRALKVGQIREGKHCFTRLWRTVACESCGTPYNASTAIDKPHRFCSRKCEGRR
jgi:hypothetical protein